MFWSFSLICHTRPFVTNKFSLTNCKKKIPVGFWPNTPGLGFRSWNSICWFSWERTPQTQGWASLELLKALLGTSTLDQPFRGSSVECDPRKMALYKRKKRQAITFFTPNFFNSSIIFVSTSTFRTTTDRLGVLWKSLHLWWKKFVLRGCAWLIFIPLGWTAQLSLRDVQTSAMSTE